jgi:integrase
MAQIISRGPNKHLVRIFLQRDSRGKRRYINRTITGTKKQAERWARENEFKRDLKRDQNPESWLNALTLTVDAFLDRWLATWKNSTRENTHWWYSDLMRRYVRPDLGAIPLSQIRARHLEQLYNELRTKGLSGRTIRHVHARLRTAMNWAVDSELISKNPANSVKAPRIEKKEMLFLSPDAARLFLAATEKNSWGLMLRFALATGVRPEELLGFQWTALDLDQPNRGAAHVKKVIVELSKKGGGWKWEEPKSLKGKRTVYFPARLVSEFKKQRIKQSELRLKMGSSYQDNDLVFATNLGTPIHRRFLIRYHFKPTLQPAGLDGAIRLYDLRHSYVTLSLLSGVPVKVVSEQAGHASVAFTLDTYAHVLPEEREGASDKLERLLIAGTGPQ